MTQPGSRLLRLGDVIESTSLSRPTIYRKVAEHTFPKPIRISSRRVAWRESEVEAWKQNPTIEAPT